MVQDAADQFAVLDLMCALQECELLPDMPGSAKAGLSRLKQSAVSSKTGTEFVAVYRSSSLISDQEDLKRVLAQSRSNNERLGISGILLHYGMTFLQVLEGEGKVVCDLIEKIAADPRHIGMEIIFTQDKHQKVFQDWSMELIGISPEEFESVLSRLSKSGTLAKKLFSSSQPRSLT